MVVLDAGEVAQVGRPLELYHRPHNRFVAGFIGSPRMNFLPGILMQTGNKGVLVELDDGSHLRVAVDGAGLKPGETVMLGIRPEHLSLNAEGDNRLQATVSMVEQLGDHSLIHLVWRKVNLVIRAESEVEAEVGEHLLVTLPEHQCHLFDKAGNAAPRLDIC
jgi:multiple sugar transport system ATP-binding protein